MRIRGISVGIVPPMKKPGKQIKIPDQFFRGISKYKYFKEIVITIAFFVVLISFNLIVPIGTGPDSGAHSVMTYCSWGNKDGVCKILDKTPHIVYRKVQVPAGVPAIGTCDEANLEISSACDEPYRSKNTTSLLLPNDALTADGTHSLFEQRIGSDDYTLTYSRLGSVQNIQFLMNGNPISKEIDLNTFQAVNSCKWPCVQTTVGKQSTTKVRIITIIPSVATRNVAIYINGYFAIGSNNKGDPPKAGSISKPVIAPNLRLATSKQMQDVLSEKNSPMSEVYLTDNYNPPYLYKTLGLLASNDVRSSFLHMRILSIFLYFISFLFVFFLFRDFRLYSTFVMATFLASVPYGLYLFATNNTSTFSFIGCVMISMLPMLYYSRPSITKIQSGVIGLYTLWAIYMCSGRADGLIFAAGGYFLISIAFNPQRTNFIKSALNFLLVSSVALYIFKRFGSSFSIHVKHGLIGSLRDATFHNAIQIPGLLAGLLGDRGPLNIWGLGQLDVPLPTTVSLSAEIGVTALFAYAIVKCNKRGLVAILFAGLLMYIPFTLTLASYHVAAGGWMFPRYGYSAYGVLILLLLLLLRKNLEEHPVGRQFLSAPILTISLAIASSVALTEYIIAEKYMNGILLDYKDGFLSAIKFLGDWVPTTVVRYRAIDSSYGWVPYLVSNPYLIVAVAFLATFALIRFVLNHFSDLNPVDELIAANSETQILEAPSLESARPKVSKPKTKTKPRKIKSKKSSYWSTKY